MSFHSKLSHFINEQHWTLGFIEQPLKDIIDGKPYEIIYVKGMPRDRWFADPFILDYDEDRIQVLVEEFCYKLCRGRIAWLSFDRKSYRLLEYKIILDLPTHLSFNERMERYIFVLKTVLREVGTCMSIILQQMR